MSSLFPERIETERLNLVHESLAETDVFERYEPMSVQNADPDEYEHIPVEPFETPHTARAYVASRNERWDSGDSGIYVVRPKDGEDGAGEPAGEAELGAMWDRRAAYFTFGLRKRFWGRGYSGERADAFVVCAFERLDLDLVRVSHTVDNENSKRAIRKYVDRWNGQHDARVRNWPSPDGGDPVDLQQYSITRENYESATVDPTVTFHD
ncbi:GNAT family N-acetyltransferase [Haloarchaeobius sp. DFWS5]|uniref:GNAT family N-acetyltransferase n=1 Tax=Haloarchaeobius sp. DFWS5 TaxID=3446114 RepID=UPI003EB697BD